LTNTRIPAITTLLTDAVKYHPIADNYHIKLKELYETNNGDVVIKTNSREFKVHESLICITSPLFKAIFENDLAIKKSRTIDYSYYSDETIDLFLRYIYYRKAIFNEEKTPSLKEIERKIPLMELFDMHMLVDGKKIISQHIVNLIDETKEFERVCEITNFFSKQVNIDGKYYRKCLEKLVVVTNNRLSKVISIHKKYVKGKAGVKNCYDNIPPGVYGRPATYVSHLCCAHIDECQLDLDKEKEIDLTCDTTKLVCCISFTMKNLSVPDAAVEKSYCCLHREGRVIRDDIIRFEKINGNMDLLMDKKVREDLTKGLFQFLNGIQYASPDGK